VNFIISCGCSGVKCGGFGTFEGVLGEDIFSGPVAVFLCTNLDGQA